MIFGGGGPKLSRSRSRSRRAKGNLARSPSPGSQAPLRVAKQQSMMIRNFICKALKATACILHRRHDSRAVNEDNELAATYDEHYAAGTSSSSNDNSISSENMSVYTSGAKNLRLYLQPMYGASTSAKKRVVHPSNSYPFDEKSFIPAPWTTSTKARTAACGGEEESLYTQQALSVYEDPTFVPEDSTVEDSSAATELRSTSRVAAANLHTVPCLQRQQYSQPIVSFSEKSTDSLVYQSGEDVDSQFSRGVQLLDFAKKLLSNEKKEGALQMFRQAARYFEAAIAQTRNNNSVVLGLVHSARCHRYMSSIVSEPDDAVRLLHAVVRLYSVARERLEEKAHSNSTMWAESSCTNRSTVSSSAASRQSIKMATRICLDTLILETLQFQAGLLVQRLNDYEQAIICYEEILRQLLHIEELQYWEATSDHSVLLDDINFVPISKEQHSELLREALTVLVSYYAILLPPNESLSFVLFEDALNLLRLRLEEQCDGDNDMVDAVSSLYKQLSEIYMAQQENDRAVLALRDFAVVKLTGPGELCTEALEIIERMGKTYERMDNYCDALECYELALLSRCRHFGNTHVSVAKALVNVARTKELNDGNSGESVNLYRAANAIFSLHVKADETNYYADCADPARALPLRRERPRPPVHAFARCENNESQDAINAAGKSSEPLADIEKQSVNSQPAVEVLSTSEEESDDDSDFRLIKLPFAYAQGDGDDVKTVFSSDNDIVTLSSCSNTSYSTRVFSSRSLGQSYRFSVNPDSTYSEEKQGTVACPEKSDNYRGYEDDESPVSKSFQPSSAAMPQDLNSRPFKKIFSLSDVLNRIQHSRQDVLNRIQHSRQGTKRRNKAY